MRATDQIPIVRGSTFLFLKVFGLFCHGSMVERILSFEAIMTLIYNHIRPFGEPCQSLPSNLRPLLTYTRIISLRLCAEPHRVRGFLPLRFHSMIKVLLSKSLIFEESVVKQGKVSVRRDRLSSACRIGRCTSRSLKLVDIHLPPLLDLPIGPLTTRSFFYPFSPESLTNAVS